MPEKIPMVELPYFATRKEQLAHNVELARDAVSMRVGYEVQHEVELSGLEPIEREGHVHTRPYWRRKPLMCAA